MSYSLSVILLIQDKYLTHINSLAEQLGWGKNNMSVCLEHTDGSIWYGCHTWAHPTFLEEFGNTPEEYSEALAELEVSVKEGCDPLDHWGQVLAENSLSRVAIGDQGVEADD